MTIKMKVQFGKFNRSDKSVNDIEYEVSPEQFWYVLPKDKVKISIYR